ncbi:hypothetical protein CMT41_07745 [Colwellia sp. MT41]|uniref:hypothetical protein n=1 Tax=Colwellia sp. MT41 TaxID=58049 RepID=UPI0007177232|nr:hypothetical protein [Colwellia sp. MT41]ALO34620.1 hypothetical protein CMT41_07745 [Colwellia sp. MT41]
MKRLLFLTALIVWPAQQFVLASQNPWKTWKQTSEQSVSYRTAAHTGKTDKNLIEIRATATVHSSIAGFLLFLQDVSNTPNWLVNASESEIIKQYSAKEHSFYIKLAKIWPFMPRILILNSSYWQNDDLSVEINITDISAMKTDKRSPLALTNIEDYLKVKVHHAHWKITPKRPEDNDASIKLTELYIEYIFTADGRGNTPKWLADHIALKSIWKSMRNIRRQLPEEKWQQQAIKGITELSVIP